MPSYEDALKTILENVKTLKEETQPLLKALGQVLAKDVYAPVDVPQSPIAGPDGYAVISEDVKNASAENPAILRILATARAGRPTSKTVKPGTAIRIMTGSVVPKGADCVIRFEDTDEPGDKNGPNVNNPREVKIFASAGHGVNIRPVGSNIKKRTLVVPAGTLLGPTQLAALASVGTAFVKVIRRPVVAIIATGDELVNPGSSLSHGQTYNGNTAAIASFVSHYGGIPRIVGIARDYEADLVKRFRKGMEADVIITSGGVSKGDYDLVRLVVGKIGKVVFARLKMAPGAAFAFGLIKKTANTSKAGIIPVFSLSGPTAGCIVNFETLVRPAVLKMRGIKETAHPEIEAISTDSHPRKMNTSLVRYTYLQKAGDKYQVKLSFMSQMGALDGIASANSLTVIPAGSEIKTGDKIKVMPLDWMNDQS